MTAAAEQAAGQQAGAGRPGREWVVLLSLLGAALVLKLVYFVCYAQQIPFCAFPIGDSAIYLDWARAILAGDLWSLSPGLRVFYRAPLYPYLLALFLRHAGNSLLPVYLFQIVLGVVNLLLCWLIARRLFSFRAAVASAALAALYAPLSFFEVKLVPVTLVITLVLSAMWLVLRSERSRPRLHWVLAGALIGLGTLAWGGTILLVLLVLVFWFFHKPRARLLHPVLFLAGWSVAVIPAFGHNLLAGKDAVPVNSNSGYTFYQGNNPAGSGTIMHPPEVFERPAGGRFPTGIRDQQVFDISYASEAMGRPVKPSEASRFWLNRGLSWIARSPGRFAWLEFQKLVLVLSDLEFPSNYFLSVEQDYVPFLRFLFVRFGLILALGAVGIVGTFRNRHRNWVLYVAILASALTMLVFYVGSRYRMPLVLPMAAFAGAGLVRIVDRFRVRKFPFLELGLAGVVLVVSMILCAVPMARRHAFVTALGYRNIGETLHRKAGDTVRARRALDRAVEIFEDNAYFGGTRFAAYTLSEILMLRAEVYLTEGSFESAVAGFRDALRADPWMTDVLSRLALTYQAWALEHTRPGTREWSARLDTARLCAEAWLCTDTTSLQALALVGDIRLALADTAGAGASFQRITDIAPAFAEPYYALGRIFLARADTASALGAYAALSRADTLNARARLETGRILEAQGQDKDAERLYRSAVLLDSLALEPGLRLGMLLAAREEHEAEASVYQGVLVRVERNPEYLNSVLRGPEFGLYLGLKLRLAAALLNLGEWERAARLCEDVLGLAPENSTARQLLDAAGQREVPKFILWQ